MPSMKRSEISRLVSGTCLRLPARRSASDRSASGPKSGLKSSAPWGGTSLDISFPRLATGVMILKFGALTAPDFGI